MNQMLFIPPVLLWTLLATEVLPNRSAQVIENEQVVADRPGSSAEASSAPGTDPLSGQELVGQAAKRLLLLPGIEAKTRQRVNICGQQLVGSGNYLQVINGRRLMLRLDLKLQVATQSVNVQQISDGDTFWIRRSQGDTTSLERVNLRRLHDVARQIGPSDTPPPPTLWMALGGLPKLLAALEANFDFDVPKLAEVGQLPVWSLEGRWKPSVLANLLPDQRPAIVAGERADLSKLPPHLPHGVTLILGRDQVIPLFPYGISYYRTEQTDEDATVPARRQALVTWELFEVRFRPDLSTSHFDYRPNDSQQVDERTDEYITRLRAAIKQGGGR